MLRRIGIGLAVIVLLVGIVQLAMFVHALNASLTVSTCTVASCSVTNYNTNTTSIGATVAQGGSDIITFTNTANVGTVNSVVLRMYHGGATGIDGSWTINFRNETSDANFCDSYTAEAHAVGPVYTQITPTNCAWTADKLDALEVVFTSGDGKSATNAFVYYASIYIDYNAPNFSPGWTNNLAANTTSVTTGATIRFNATGTDGEGDNYRLTVCNSNSINNGYPGTCTGNTVCTSGVTSSGAEASCTNVTVAGQEPSFTAYGFICDEGSSTCNTSTSVAITVTPNQPPDWTNNLAVNTSYAAVGDVLNFNATATDPEGDQYRLTVCDSNSISNGYPGTCTGNTVCTSGATNSGAEASCTNITTISQTLNAYGFICDAGSSTCNTSTTTAVTIDTCTYRSGNWNVNMSDACTIAASTDLGSNSLIFSGPSGSFTIQSGVTVSAKEIRIEPTDFNGDFIIEVATGGQLTFQP